MDFYPSKGSAQGFLLNQSVPSSAPLTPVSGGERGKESQPCGPNPARELLCDPGITHSISRPLTVFSADFNLDIVQNLTKPEAFKSLGASPQSFLQNPPARWVFNPFTFGLFLESWKFAR